MKEKPFNHIRKRLFEIIEIAEDDTISHVYDMFMLIMIVVSFIPLAFKQELTAFRIIEIVATAVFSLDYFFRWITADFKNQKYKKAVSLIIYPLTPWAIIDLLSILPTLTTLNNTFRLLRLFRMARALRVFRVFKAFRYSKSFSVIINVLKKSKNALSAVIALAVGYILISALIVFNVEPESFGNFFDAVYWATVSLTTVGYGDIYPVSTLGQIVTMFSSFFGIAIVALPAGIITAGYMDEIQAHNNKEDSDEG